MMPYIQPDPPAYVYQMPTEMARAFSDDGRAAFKNIQKLVNPAVDAPVEERIADAIREIRRKIAAEFGIGKTNDRLIQMDGLDGDIYHLLVEAPLSSAAQRDAVSERVVNWIINHPDSVIQERTSVEIFGPNA